MRRSRNLEGCFQPGCPGELKLFFVEAKKFLEAEFKCGGDMKKVRRPASDRFVVSGSKLLGAAEGFGEVERLMDQEQSGIQVVIQFAKEARAIGGGDTSRPNEQANRIADLQTMLGCEGQSFAFLLHVSDSARSAMWLGKVKTQDKTGIRVGAHCSAGTFVCLVQPTDIRGGQGAISKARSDAALEVREFDFVALFAGKNAEIRDDFTAIGDRDFGASVFLQNSTPTFGEFADGDGFHAGHYVRQARGLQWCIGMIGGVNRRAVGEVSGRGGGLRAWRVGLRIESD